jgi:hypothetical protein
MFSSATPQYRPGTPLDSILLDGWARGFNVVQTVAEAFSSGFVVTPGEVQFVWSCEDAKYDAYCKEFNSDHSTEVADVDFGSLP